MSSTATIIIAILSSGVVAALVSALMQKRNEKEQRIFNAKIEVIHIPELFRQINGKLKDKNPQNDAIPETYPLLRAIQYFVFYSRER